MASSSKSQAKAVTKPVKAEAKLTAKTIAAKVPKATADPSMQFHYSRELRTRTNALLTVIETAPNPAVHGSTLADLVAELTEAGMDYYFLRALKQAKVGFVAEQSARLGMSGAVKLISSVSRKFIERMDSAQLLVVAQHIRSLG